ncbi:MAG: TIGR02597 family protein [Verrucomicrobiota bacterium]
MKIKTLQILFLTIAFAVLLLESHAQTTANTTPVGYINVSIPAATPPTITEQSVAFSAPLYNSPDFQGAVASIDNTTTITLTGAAFTTGNFATAVAPRGLRVMTGAQVGVLFLVTANTTNQITVALPSGVTDINTILTVGNTVQIVPVNTFGSLFGTTTPILTSGASANDADVVFLLSKSGGADLWQTYFHNGSNWRLAGAVSNQNNTIIYPDEGVFIVHRGTSPVTLTMMGAVPSTNEQTDLFGSGSTFLANRFPVDIQLVNSGIHTISGWVTNASPNVADKVYLWDTTSRVWQTYFHNGTNWRRAGSGANQNTTVIKAGSAVVLSRSSATGTALNQPLPYTP